MEKFATENLILLEFLVDQINMDYDVQKEVSNIMGETCVSFQFLDNAPLLICEQDFANKQQLGVDQNVKSGKSCLFSLTPDQAKECAQNFDIVVEIFRKMAKGVLPDQVPIGKSLVSIVSLFTELVDSITSSGETPAAKTLKDCFKITNSKGDSVGHISVYIRMSCFGKLIVTQFQMNLEDKSVQFKAKEGHYLFKYNKGRGGDRAGGGKANPCDDYQRRMLPQETNLTCPQTSCADAMKAGQNQQPPQQSIVQDHGSCPVRPNCPGEKSNQRIVPPNEPCPVQPCLFQPAPQMAPPPSMFPMDNQGMPPCAFPQQQMQQSMPPCAMSQMPQMLYGPQGGFPMGQFPFPQGPQMPYPMGGGGNDAPCNECRQQAPPPIPDDPNAAYQEIGASMGGNAITIRVHKDKAKVEDVTDSDITESDSRSCVCGIEGFGKRRNKRRNQPNPQQYNAPPPCKPNMQQQLAMRGVPDQSAPFSFKMAGCGQAANSNVIANPPTCTAKDGTVFTEITDPNKEVFVLRIGKKSEGVDKKNNLELELCTPKGPDIKPIPKKETRDTQYDEADCKDAGGGKGNGKGKGGKGGKGDKGGKGGKGGKKKK